MVIVPVEIIGSYEYMLTILIYKDSAFLRESWLSGKKICFCMVKGIISIKKGDKAPKKNFSHATMQ